MLLAFSATALHTAYDGISSQASAQTAGQTNWTGGGGTWREDQTTLDWFDSTGQTQGYWDNTGKKAEFTGAGGTVNISDVNNKNVQASGLDFTKATGAYILGGDNLYTSGSQFTLDAGSHGATISNLITDSHVTGGSDIVVNGNGGTGTIALNNGLTDNKTTINGGALTLDNAQGNNPTYTSSEIDLNNNATFGIGETNSTTVTVGTASQPGNINIKNSSTLSIGDKATGTVVGNVNIDSSSTLNINYNNSSSNYPFNGSGTIQGNVDNSGGVTMGGGSNNQVVQTVGEVTGKFTNEKTGNLTLLDGSVSYGNDVIDGGA